MVVRIHNVSKWAILRPGDMLELKGAEARKVRVELNSPAPTRLDLVIDDKATFLTVFEGHQVVEFTAPPESYLVATSEDEVWFFTNDGDEVATARPEAVSFTKIANRRARNPELERMMFKMEQNMNRRLDALAAEQAAALAAREAAIPHDPETGEIEDDQDGNGLPDGGEGTPEGGEGGGSEPPAKG